MTQNMHHQKTLITHCFNKAAATYDAHCNMQRLCGVALLEILKSLNLNPASIIDLGCGTGLITQKLAESFSRVPLYVIDSAEQMLEHAKTRLNSSLIKVFKLDFDELHRLGKNFDLAFSNMALHWSPNLAKTLSAIYHCLAKEGVLIFAIPLKGTLKELKSYSRREFLSFQEVERLLVSANLKILYHNTQIYEENFVNALEALRSLKRVGANYVDHRKANIAYPTFKALSSPHNFSLTYNTVFFATQKL